MLTDHACLADHPRRARLGVGSWRDGLPFGITRGVIIRSHASLVTPRTCVVLVNVRLMQAWAVVEKAEIAALVGLRGLIEEE